MSKLFELNAEYREDGKKRFILLPDIRCFDSVETADKAVLAAFTYRKQQLEHKIKEYETHLESTKKMLKELLQEINHGH